MDITGPPDPAKVMEFLGKMDPKDQEKRAVKIWKKWEKKGVGTQKHTETVESLGWLRHLCSLKLWFVPLAFKRAKPAGSNWPKNRPNNISKVCSCFSHAEKKGQ